MLPGRARSLKAWTLALAALVACGGDESAPIPAEPPASAADERAGPAGAQWELVEAMREAGARLPHPSDGGGRAWLVPDPDATVAVDLPGRFEIIYEVGPLGIATGGSVFLQVSPFWGWSTPQVEVPDAPGFTTIEPIAGKVTDHEPAANAIAGNEPAASAIAESEPGASAIELEAATLDQQLLVIHVTGRALVAGKRGRSD